MQTREDAVALAKSMVATGNSLGMEVTAQVTEMDNPIGSMFGNSHEIVECIQCLKGEGPSDTMELVYSQADGLGLDIRAAIIDGSALNEFREMCVRQGVDTDDVAKLVENPWDLLDKAPVETEITIQNPGYIAQIHALTIGEILCKLGAGRTGENPDIDHGIGAELLVEIGQEVSFGEPWIRFDTREKLSGEMIEAIQNSLTLSNSEIKKSSRILEIIKD
jgi:thymidine phosphorylase